MTHLPAWIARHWRGLAELAAAWLAVQFPLGVAVGRLLGAASRHEDGELA